MVEFFCVFFAFIFSFRFYADEPAACLPRLCPTVEAGTPPRRRVCGREQRDYSILLPICKSFCDSAVIGAGSVVTRDIPPRVVACGVPCRVMRAITPADRDRYPFHESIAAKYGK